MILININYFVSYYTSPTATNIWCSYMFSSSSLVMKLHVWSDCPRKLGNHARLTSSVHRTESTSLGTCQMLLSENTRQGEQWHNTVSVTDCAAFSGTYHGWTVHTQYFMQHFQAGTQQYISAYTCYIIWVGRMLLPNLENLSRTLGLMFPLFWKVPLDFKFLFF